MQRIAAWYLCAFLVGLGVLDVGVGLLRGVYPSQATPMALVGVGIGVLVLRHELRVFPVASAALSDEEYAIRRDNAMLSYGLGIGFLVFGGVFALFSILNAVTQSNAFRADADLRAGTSAVSIIFVIIFNAVVCGMEILGARAYFKGRDGLAV